MLNGLDLFSGIGGISLALDPWVRTAAYCENDPYAQSVLLTNMHGGLLHEAPIWDDVRTLLASYLPPIDIVTAGFPCQDISVAGTGLGLEGSRSGLFFEIVRLVCELRPRFVFLENVPAITVRGLDRILLEFTAMGYDCRWTIVSAAEIGAVHIRERWFLLAYSYSERLREECRKKVRRNNAKRSRPLVNNSESKERGTAWPPFRYLEPRVDRTGHGIPFRVDRARTLGNAVVPAQAREAFMRLAGLK